MSFSITREETYTLIIFEEDTLIALDELIAECEPLIEECPFFILNFDSSITQIDTDSEEKILNLYEMVKAHKGSIVIVELEEKLVSKFKKAGIECLFTESEAVDYIFLEQLESQLGDDETVD